MLSNFAMWPACASPEASARHGNLWPLFLLALLLGGHWSHASIPPPRLLFSFSAGHCRVGWRRDTNAGQTHRIRRMNEKEWESPLVWRRMGPVPWWTVTSGHLWLADPAMWPVAPPSRTLSASVHCIAHYPSWLTTTFTVPGSCMSCLSSV